jgi:hypothetical protein
VLRIVTEVVSLERILWEAHVEGPRTGGLLEIGCDDAEFDWREFVETIRNLVVV